MIGWVLLAAELRRWTRQGRRPQLWWRDDDTRAPTPALARLIAYAAADGIPVALAVIPADLDPTLAAFLKAQPLIGVLQHGVDHVNGGPPDRPSQFGREATEAQIAARLSWGWTQLEAFERRLPVYVPPWNDLQPNVLAALKGAGFAGVSAWAGRREAGRLDAHLDLMRWRGIPRFVGRGKFLGRLRRALAQRRRQQAWDDPIGLLTHHLDHDEAAWAFLEALLAFAPLRAAADWRGVDALLGLASTRA
jgi:predicted deacetylase